MIALRKPLKISAAIRNGRRSGGFSPHQFHIREKTHVYEICHGRLGRVRVACDALRLRKRRRRPPTAPTWRRRRHRDFSFKGDWRASKVVGLNVYNDNNESIGSINDLLTDKSGNIKAVVISVGGFLGVGAHLVAVPFDKIKFVNEPVAYTGVSSAPNAARQPAAFDHHHRCREHQHGTGLGARVETQSVVSGPRGVQRDQG